MSTHSRPSGPVGAEATLRGEAQARLAAIIESSDDAIVSKSLDGIIMSWNRGAERIFGWQAHEVIGKPITIIIPPDRQAEEPFILKRIAAGERVDHFETIRQTRDGRLINVSVTISPVRDEAGRIIGISKIARDITMQMRFQAELRAAKDAAEAASQAKDHFLSVLSHELRTPLTPVLAAISMMEEDPQMPRHLVEPMAMIRRNVETQTRLVDDLLDLTRIARGKIQLYPEALDAHAALRGVVAMFQHDLDEKGLSMTLSLRARRHHVWVDPGRFQQVVLNLLSNAIKFTPEGGSITITSANEDEAIILKVIDSGIGIEPSVLPRLFKPFEQGDRGFTRTFGGLGLGLSIVRSLMEMHRGTITMESAGADQGTTATLRLNTVIPEERPSAAGSVGAITGSPQRILLVEDHRDTRQVLSRLLTSLGCQVKAAANMKEAIELGDREPFDLVLSDIGLPDGSGIEVMRHLAARHGLRGIALSGYGQEEDVRRSREAGFVAHLTKPITLRTLQECILRVTA